MPVHTSRRRKTTWTSTRHGKPITVRATKKVWEVNRPATTRKQKKWKPNISPKIYPQKIEITKEGDLWRVDLKNGYDTIFKSSLDRDFRVVAKTAVDWQKERKFNDKEIPLTFPKLKKELEKK